MTRQIYLSLGIFACAAIAGGAIIYHRTRAPIACDSTEAADRLHAILQGTLHLDSVFINDVRTVAGGPFATRYDCTAEIAEIQGNTNASAMHWRSLDFTITKPRPSGPSVITARLGAETTLEPRQPGFWQRLFARL